MPLIAQDEADLTPEEIALLRIEQSRESGSTALDLSDLGLTSLPPELWELTALSFLDLNGNQLTELPPEIGTLTSLTLLDLHNNQLTHLPPEIGQLTMLSQLLIYDNALVRLPPEVGNLISLQHFGLGGNELSALPRTLYNLLNLQTITLDRNPLHFPPPQIVRAGRSAMFQFLQHPQPSAPYRVDGVMLGTLVMLMVSFVGGAILYLKLLNMPFFR